MAFPRLVLVTILAVLLVACAGGGQPAAVPSPTAGPPAATTAPAAPPATVPATETAAPTTAPATDTAAPVPATPTIAAAASATPAPAPPTAAPTGTPAAGTAATAPPAEAGPLVAQTLIVPSALKTGPFATTHTLRLPQTFNISLFAAGLNIPRWIVSGPDGNLWVTERGAGRVLVYPPQGSAATPGQPRVFASGLNAPHGLAFYGGYVYVAETTRVLRIKDANGQAAGDPQVIIAGLPADGRHTTRTLLFTPDNKLLVSIGSSCDVCQEQDNRRAAVMIYDTGGSNGRLYASGLRNAVGLALNPVSQQVWFTDNGSDDLGNDLPPDTIGTLKDGAFYGWPDCYGDHKVDTSFGGNAQRCAQMTVAELPIEPHAAVLGMTFLPAQGWPAPYAGNLLAAYHGQTIGSAGHGYKIARVPLANGQPAGGDTDFVTGFLQNGSAWGRPVDLAAGSDGAVYVTDDHAGAIYRIFPAGP